MDGEPSEFSHLDARGRARMVDVTDKDPTGRRALARARIELGAEVRRRLFDGDLPKGDALAVVRIAAIQGAKDTARTIPLCHPLPLSSVQVSVEPVDDSDGAVEIRCEVRCHGTTGVEMEALCGVSTGALALYDMCKALDKGLSIGPIELLEKDGGKSGSYRRS